MTGVIEAVCVYSRTVHVHIHTLDLPPPPFQLTHGVSPPSICSTNGTVNYACDVYLRISVMSYLVFTAGAFAVVSKLYLHSTLLSGVVAQLARQV